MYGKDPQLSSKSEIGKSAQILGNKTQRVCEQTRKYFKEKVKKLKITHKLLEKRQPIPKMKKLFYISDSYNVMKLNVPEFRACTSFSVGQPHH